MEEDIKILEEFKKNGYHTLMMEYGSRNKTNLKLETAIENLIKGYREKEESESYLYDAYQDAGKKMFEYSEQNEELLKKLKDIEADLYEANSRIEDQLSIINDLEADLLSVYMKGIVDSNELWRQSIHKKLDVYKDSCNVVDTLIADVLRDLLEEKFNGATKNN